MVAMKKQTAFIVRSFSPLSLDETSYVQELPLIFQFIKVQYLHVTRSKFPSFYFFLIYV